jgi:hypothetical protein
MYLTAWDLLAVMIALVVSVTLVITTALANARLQQSRDYWRKVYHNYKFATEADAMGKPVLWDSASESWKVR